MNQRGIVLCIAVVIISMAAVQALGYDSSVKPISHQPVIGPHSQLPPPDCFPATSGPRNDTDPVGQTWVMGATWYDIQHNCTCGHQVYVDRDGYVHVAWMKGLESGAINRHIYYQLLSPAGNLLFPGGGVQVDIMSRAGFTDLELYPDNRALPCFHQGQGGATNFHTAQAFDYIPRAGAFAAVEPPWVYEFGVDMEVIWPKVARSLDNGLHILSTENPGAGGIPERHYYIRGVFDPTSFTIDFPPQQDLVCWTMTISGTVAASPVSNRVAVGWLKPWATDPTDTTQHDNDFVVVISNNGLNWNWADTINITNWIEPDPGLLPDTVRANKDTLRCFAEIDLIFDYNDVLHVFFNTEAYYHYEGTISRGNSFIWHWDEVNRVYSIVANGWFEYPHFSPGAWNKFTTRPQAAIDSATGDIYCMYQRYNQPVATSTWGFPYQIGDSTDFSAAGWPNGEVWVTKSVDGGLSWAEGTNVTRTTSPNALPGDCMSELTPSMHRRVVNGCCHIFYVLDRDAGAVVQTEGTWTLNDVIYQRVPVDSIASGPILPPHPMHCDSSGMPGTAPPLNLAVTLTPHNPPVVVPSGGGNFIYTAQIENLSGLTETFDAWTLAILPSGAVYGPIILRRDLPIAGNAAISRVLTQFVPGNAPSGYYYYVGKVGIYPTAVAADSFQFVKMTGDAPPAHNLGWACFGWEEDDEAVSIHHSSFILHPCIPNPFNPSTAISFQIQAASFVKLAVYDITGREVASLVNGHLSSGHHEIAFDGTELASGVYFARLDANGINQTVKLLLVK